MLPTGHTAAGFLTAYTVLKVARPELEPSQVNQLLLLGAFFGFAPDLDVFWFFFKHHTLLVSGEATVKDPHRKFFSHAPVYWLALAVIVYLASGSLIAGLIVWLASWSHFILDSIEYGIPWLQPFTGKLYALFNAEKKIILIKDTNFFRHSLQFLKVYSSRPSFYLEAAIIIIAIIILLNTNLY